MSRRLADEVRTLDADSVAKVMTVNHTKVFSTTPESELSAFHALAVGDSILFSYNSYNLKAHAKWRQVMWVKDGRATSISLPVEPIAVYEGQDSAFLYYLDNIQKSDVVNAMILKKGSNTIEDYKSSIPIDDQMVGNFTQGNLFFVTLDKTFSKLSLLELRGTKVIGRKQF